MATYKAVINKNGVLAMPATGDNFQVDGTLATNAIDAITATSLTIGGTNATTIYMSKTGATVYLWGYQYITQGLNFPNFAKISMGDDGGSEIWHDVSTTTGHLGSAQGYNWMCDALFQVPLIDSIGSTSDLYIGSYSAYTRDVYIGRSGRVVYCQGKLGVGATPSAYFDVAGTNTLFQVYQCQSAMVTGSNNGCGIYLGLNSVGNALNATAAIEASWGGATTPQVAIGVVRDSLKANIIMDYNNNTYFRTGTTNRWTIDSSGNLTAAAMTQVLNAGLIGTNSATSLIFRTNSATRWTIDTSGNLTASTGSIYLPSSSSIYTNSVLTINNGVLASDTVHGSRGNGSLHTVATTGTAGFMSSTDKSKLDGIGAGAVRSWVVFAGYAAGPTGTNTVYLCPGGMDDTSPKAQRMDMPVPFACTITSVWIQCATGSTGGSWYIAIRKNGNVTNLGSPVTLTAGTTSGSRGTESISLAQGDYICVACVGNGSITVGASQICVSLAISYA